MKYFVRTVVICTESSKEILCDMKYTPVCFLWFMEIHNDLKALTGAELKLVVSSIRKHQDPYMSLQREKAVHIYALHNVLFNN